jgi:hypothetical protein
VRLTLKLLVVTIVAVVIVYYAIAAVNVSGIRSTNLTDADFIRQRCPIHIVRPEWVSNQPDLLLNWTWAEIKARFGLVAILWLCSVSIIARCHLRKPAKK